MLSASRTRNCCRTGSSALTTLRLLTKSVCHLSADSKSGAQTGSQARPAAFILRSIAKRVSRLKLHVFLSIAKSTHRSTLVHRRLDLGGKADVFNKELGYLETQRAEIFVDLGPNRFADPLVLSSKIERRYLQFTESV